MNYSLEFWKLAFSDPKAEWRNWNGPYFDNHYPTRKDWIAGGELDYLESDMRKVIYVDGKMVGSVSAYYDDGYLERWLEVGLAIYDERKWGQGIGRQALELWIDELFQRISLPHIGLTTWSGNQRMMKLADRLGLKCEGRIRKVRYWQNTYYDSVKYGVLREEWENR